MGTCSVDTCTLPASSRDLCTGHYQRLRLHGDVRADIPLRRTSTAVVREQRAPYARVPLPDGLREPSTDGICVVPECAGPVFKRSLCGLHYGRFQRTGTVHLPVAVGATGVCIVRGCGRSAPAVGSMGAAGYCAGHLKRIAVYGDPRADIPFKKQGGSLEDYITQRLDVSLGEAGCHPWTGPINTAGYGIAQHRSLRHGAGSSPRAHRVVFEHVTGIVIPDGMHLDHTCHWRDPFCPGGAECQHRRCCNPRHLEIVTPEENARRSRKHMDAGMLCAEKHPVTSLRFEVWAVCSECDERHPVPEDLWFRIALSNTRESRASSPSL